MSEKKLQKQLTDHRKAIDVDHFDVTIRELLRMVEEDELIRAPEYQRKFRWDETGESELIESLFLGLPVPSVFVATNEDGTWEVVDGLQRISTIIHFLTSSKRLLAEIDKASPLTLTGLKKLTNYNGLAKKDLPRPIQLQLERRPIRVTALSDKSEIDVRFEVFERLNRGGINLTEQEVRACIYRGDFSELLRELAKLPEYRSLLKLQKKKRSDGTREEVVLKVFAYLDKQATFDGRVAYFLNDYMSWAKDNRDIDASRILFTKAVKDIAAIIDGAFLRKNYHNTPLNQFEAVLVATSRILKDGNSIVNPGKDWLNDLELVKHSTKGTNTRASLNGRIDRAYALLSGQVAPAFE